MDILSLTDERIANMWLKCAEESGEADLCYNIGLLYAFGQGFEMDTEEAINWFLKAANRGSVEAMNNLGSMYGQVRNFALAAEWFQRAVDNGDEMAMRNLVKCRERMTTE